MQNENKKNEHGSYDEIQDLDYELMVKFIYSYYKINEFEQGHIKFSDMKRIVSSMDHKEVKTLFENIIDLIDNYAE